MTAHPALGNHVRTHRAAGGFTGFQNSPAGRALFLSIAGAALGFIPGLLVALITDFVPALLVFPVIGGAIGFLWARRLTAAAAVTEARIHERGVVLVDQRGERAVGWQDIASFEGRHLQTTVGVAPFVDVKGATNHAYALGTRDGTRFWLDDRIENVAALAETIVRASGVTVTRLR